jgi:hypothetical protein
MIKNQIFKQKKQLKSNANKIYITEDLIRYRQQPFLLFLDVIRWFSLDGLVLTRVADILTAICSK